MVLWLLFSFFFFSSFCPLFDILKTQKPLWGWGKRGYYFLDRRGKWAPLNYLAFGLISAGLDWNFTNRGGKSRRRWPYSLHSHPGEAFDFLPTSAKVTVLELPIMPSPEFCPSELTGALSPSTTCCLACEVLLSAMWIGLKAIVIWLKKKIT